MEKEWNRKIFGTKKRGFRSLRKPRSLSKKVTEKWPFSRIGDENAV